MVVLGFARFLVIIASALLVFVLLRIGYPKYTVYMYVAAVYLLSFATVVMSIIHMTLVDRGGGVIKLIKYSSSFTEFPILRYELTLTFFLS